MLYARDYRLNARETLSGNWLLSVAVTFVAVLLGRAIVDSGVDIDININASRFLNERFLEKLPVILHSLVTISTPSDKFIKCVPKQIGTHFYFFSFI